MSDPADPPERLDQVGPVPGADHHAHGHDDGLPRHLLEHPLAGDQAHPIGAARSNDPGRDDSPATDVPMSPPLEPAWRGDDVIAPGAEAPRPLIERIGMAAIALVLAALFGGVALAAFSGGEPFLAAMGAIGCLMTLWVGALTLFRG